MMEFYGYSKCSTCRKAKALLNSRGINYKDIDITENPPSQALLKSILKAGDYELKQLFNTSGQLYRELGMKDKMAQLTEAAAIKLLAAHGKLIKRPIITTGKQHVVGFDETKIKRLLG